MIITEQDSKILAIASLDSEQSVPEISRESGFGEHVVRYTLNKLLLNKSIKIIPFIDAEKLSLKRYQVLFSINPSSAKDEDSFISYLLDEPRIYWLIELSGQYQYSAGLYAKSEAELLEFFESLGNNFKEMSLSKTISKIINQTHFGRDYLSEKKSKLNPIELKAETNINFQVDELDSKILQTISNANFKNWNSVARILSVPPSSLDQRVKRLKRKGVLSRLIYSLNSEANTREQYRLFVSVSEYSVNLRRQIKIYCKEHPDIITLLENIGIVDFEIKFEVESSLKASKFRNKFCQKFNKKLKHVILISQIKEHKLNFFQDKSLVARNCSQG